MKAATPPDRLGRVGKALWRAINRELVTSSKDGAEWRFDGRELALLELACAQLDEIAELEGLLKSDGPVTAGSKGQPRLNAVLGELRQARLACARLLGEIGLPVDGDTKPETAASRRGRKAAQKRWARVESIEDRRRAGAGRG